MVELAITERAPQPLKRLLAAVVCAVLLLAFWSWVWIVAIGLGQLFSSTDDGACQQPEYLYGAALIAIAVFGLMTSGLGVGRAGSLVLGRARRGAYAWPAVVTVLLAFAAIATMTVLKPGFTLVPGAC